MTREIATDHIRRYLLGELPPDDEAVVERAYFADPDFLARVEEVQHDLTHAYVTGHLTTVQRTRFEQRLSTTSDQRVELALTQALHEIAAAPSTDVDWRSRAASLRAYATPLRWAMAGLVLAIMLLALWPSASRPDDIVRDAPRESTPAPTAPSPTTPSTVPPDVNNPATRDTASPPEMRVATLVLTSGLTRDTGTPPTLTITRGVTDITLLLPPNEAPRDRQPARIETVEGRVIWTGIVDRERRGSSSDLRDAVHLSASVVVRGDYILSVGDGVDSYYFRVR